MATLNNTSRLKVAKTLRVWFGWLASPASKLTADMLADCNMQMIIRHAPCAANLKYKLILNRFWYTVCPQWKGDEGILRVDRMQTNYRLLYTKQILLSHNSMQGKGFSSHFNL